MSATAVRPGSGAPPLSRLRLPRVLARNATTAMAYVGLCLLLIAYGIVAHHPFSAENITSMMNSTVILVVVGVAETIVIVAGGIDLSVAGTMTVANTFVATTMNPNGDALNMLWVIVATLTIGGFIGVVNGFFVARARLAPLIVTLATLSITQGIALKILPTPGGGVPITLTNLTGNTALDIPIGAVLIALVLVIWWIVKQSRLGRDIYALGGDEAAAYANGIRVLRTKIAAYVLAGIFAAAAGIVLTSQTSSGDPNAGTSFILESLVVVVLGGTSLAGGRGGVGGTLAGAFILTLINDIVFFAGVSSFYQPLFQGIILLLAVAAASVRLSSRALSEAGT